MAAADCIRVNADYESVLFKGKSAPTANHAIEFLALYLQDLPVLSDIDYAPSYLDQVRNFSGRKPRVVKKGNALNWWGPLTRPDQEKWLNSKITSTKLAIGEGWSEAKILTKDQIRNLHVGTDLIVKDPFGMSGRGLVALQAGKEIHLPASLPDQLIVEPRLDRKFDFSHFVFPDGKVIAYENIVDERFQYRGTIIEKSGQSTEDLSFAGLISAREWEKFHHALRKIREHYGTDCPYGYSVDSFAYESDGELRIYPLSEINARRTMGLLSYEFFRMSGEDRRTSLSLKRPVFQESVKLSPEKAFFDIYLSYG